MEEIDFSEIQQVLNEILGNEMDFQDMVRQGMEGKSLLSPESLGSLFQKIFLEELLAQKQMWLHILILAIAAAVLIHFADVFQNQSVSQISFCMIYMILFLILIASFQSSMGIAKGVLKSMQNFMTVLAPAYFLAMMLTSYITSAGIYYEFILLLISVVRWFTEAFVMPCIEIYVLLILANYLSKEAFCRADRHGGELEPEGSAGACDGVSYDTGNHFSGGRRLSDIHGQQGPGDGSRGGKYQRFGDGSGSRLRYAD